MNLKKLVAICLLAIPADSPLVAENWVTVTPVILPQKPSFNWIQAAETVIRNAREGTLELNSTPNPTNAVQYKLCHGKIKVENLMYSTSAPQWDGVINPSYPFNEEKGNVAWSLIHAYSSEGKASLDALRVVYDSTDDADSLSDTNENNRLTSYRFRKIPATGEFNSSASHTVVARVGKQSRLSFGNYTPQAIGVRADDSIIDNGPPTQEAEHVYVLVHSRLYNGAGTYDGIQVIRDYVNEVITETGDFGLITSAMLKFDPSSFSSASVYIVRDPTHLILSVGRDGRVVVTNGRDGRYYHLYHKSRVQDHWKFMGSMAGKTPFLINLGDPQHFFSVTEK